MKTMPGTLASAVLAIVAIAAYGQAANSGEGEQSDASSDASVTLIGHTPPQVLDGTAMRVSHYDPEKKLRLVLAIQVPHMAEEEQFLAELQDRQSPLFHQFLSAEEWNARFAPSAEDEQKVVDWAESQGLTVTNRFANRLLVDLEAPVGVIEKVFNVTINNYQVDDEVDFSNDRDPAIPAHLSGIVSAVLGLNSIQRMRRVGSGSKLKGPDYVPGPVYSVGESSQGDGDPTKAPWNQSAEMTSDPSDAMATGPTNHFLNPSEIFSSQAYNYTALYALGHCCNPHHDAGGSPPDSSIALVTGGSFLGEDANTFFKQYGLAWNYTVYSVDGTNPPGKKCTQGSSGCSLPGLDDEAPLDVEYSTAMANSFGSANDTAHVYVYEFLNGLLSTSVDGYNFILNDDHARVVSTSYGSAEPSPSQDGFIVTVLQPIFHNMVGRGWTLISASGDNGSTDGCQDAVVVHYPASDPNFVAAGGTALTLYTNGDYDGEVAWTGGTKAKSCSSNNGGGGGGASAIFSQPSWQSGLGGSMRLLPDISLNAGGVSQWDYCTDEGCQQLGFNGWGGVGGTSIVAPELAGFFAQENAYLAFIGNKCGSDGTFRCDSIGNPNPIIYYEAMHKNAAHDPFYDITKGCNSNNITKEYDLKSYCAHAGYDEATGWGSANMLQLAWAINDELTKAKGKPYITMTGPEKNKWYNTNQTVTWTIHDFVGPGLPESIGTGIAGWTAAWDALPDDPTSEPTPGAGNSFYSGPEFPNQSTGCLAFEPKSGCASFTIQGCHTAYARGWNNQGWSTEGNSINPETYGPVCYDTVAPTIGISNNSASPEVSGWYTKPVTVTLKASDPGDSNASGVSKIFYGSSNTRCAPGYLSYCTEYKSPFTVSAPGVQVFNVFSVDNAGNFSEILPDVLKIDTGGPTILVGYDPPPPASGWYNGDETVSLSASDPAGIADIYYAFNNTACTPSTPASCSIYHEPFVLSLQGIETLNAFSRNTIGIDSSLASVTIKIDTTLPVTTASLSGTEVGAQWQSAVGVVLTATDNLSGVKATYFSIDGGTAVTYSGPFNVALAGSHTLNYWSVDVAGNTETANSQPLIIDSPTTAMLTASPNPSVIGQSVTLTATIASTLTGTPAGTVSFFNGTALLGTGTLSNGVATFATSALPLGSDTLQATYAGATYYLAATPATYAQTVEQLPTATATTTVVTFNPAAIGMSAASAQTLTASFTISNFKGSFTPTATLHYGRDYTLGAINCTGGGPETCTVAVSFLPTLPGARKDAVQLMAGSTILATALLGGTGQGPMALMQPGVVTSPISAAPYYIYQSVVDENGTVYFLSDNGNAVYSLAKGSNSPSTVPVTGLSSPHGIDIDGAGTLYIAQGSSSIITYNTVTGVQGAISVIPPAPYKPCSTVEYVYSVVVDDAGDLFAVESECSQIFELKADGSYATTAVDPTMIGLGIIAVDASDNVFVSGYDINELTAGGVQTQINTVGASEGLQVDAADTLYATRYTGTGGVVELPASNYSAPAFGLDPASSPLGEGLGSDGTLYVGNYTDLDKVDRSQGAIAFGEQTVGFESTAQNVSLYNGGNEPLTVSNIAISGPPFTLLPGGTNNCTVGLVIAPGASCEVAVTITPPHAGTYSGTVTFTSNSLNTASTVQTVALTAFVYGVYMVPSPTALTFANQATGTTSAASMVMLTNEGDLYAAGIETPTSSNPAFTPTLGTCTVSIAVGSSCQLTVTFSPALAQPYSGTITVPAYSGGGGTTPSATFTVSGMGVASPAPTPPASSLRGPQ
jgi:hypothetical protein